LVITCREKNKTQTKQKQKTQTPNKTSKQTQKNQERQDEVDPASTVLRGELSTEIGCSLRSFSWWCQ
jgi:hypothetical protein